MTFVRAKEDIDIPTHKIGKGRTADIPAAIAQKLKREGRLEIVSNERGIQTLYGAETADRGTIVPDQPKTAGKRKPASR